MSDFYDQTVSIARAVNILGLQNLEQVKVFIITEFIRLNNVGPRIHPGGAPLAPPPIEDGWFISFYGNSDGYQWPPIMNICPLNDPYVKAEYYTFTVADAGPPPWANPAADHLIVGTLLFKKVNFSTEKLVLLTLDETHIDCPPAIRTALSIKYDPYTSKRLHNPNAFHDPAVQEWFDTTLSRERIISAWEPQLGRSIYKLAKKALHTWMPPERIPFVEPQPSAEEIAELLRISNLFTDTYRRLERENKKFVDMNRFFAAIPYRNIMSLKRVLKR